MFWTITKVKGGCTHNLESYRMSTDRASFRWIWAAGGKPGECRFHHLEMKLLYVYWSSHIEDWSFPDFPFCWNGLTSGEKKSCVCSCRNFCYLHAFIEACKALGYQRSQLLTKSLHFLDREIQLRILTVLVKIVTAAIQNDRIQLTLRSLC